MQDPATQNEVEGVHLAFCCESKKHMSQSFVSEISQLVAHHSTLSIATISARLEQVHDRWLLRTQKTHA